MDRWDNGVSTHTLSGVVAEIGKRVGRRWRAWAPRFRSARAQKLAVEPDPEALFELLMSYVKARAALRVGISDDGARIAPGTEETYGFSVDRLCRWLRLTNANLARLTSEQATAFGWWELSEHYSPKTVKMDLAIVRQLQKALAWAGASVYRTTLPRVQDRPDYLKRIPSPWPLFASALAATTALALGGDDPDALMLAVALHLLGVCGLRAGEACGLDWRDFDSARGALLVRRAKGGKEREVPAIGETAVLLGRLSPGAPTDDPILWRYLPRRACRTARRSRATPNSLLRLVSRWEEAHGLARGCHVLRHGIGLRVAETAGIEAARDLLGHSTVRTTEIYARRNRVMELGEILQSKALGK